MPIALVLAALPVAAQRSYSATVSHVSDGDTLWIKPAEGGPPRKLRLEGIDAPEICQSGGQEAREALTRRVLHKQVRVSVRRNDDYGRGLARIEVQGVDVGAQMVSAGQAWSYRWRRSAGPYAAEEAAARQARRGVFADPNAQVPRDFRKRHGPCQTAQR